MKNINEYLTQDMIDNPKSYATHYMKVDPSVLFIVKSNLPQLIFINGKWDFGNVYEGLLNPISLVYS